MIVFKEKDYSAKGTMAWRVKRMAVPFLQGSTGMTKKEAIKTVAATNVKGISAGKKEFGKYAKKNPGAVVGGVTGTLVPVPGATFVGVHAGKAAQGAVRNVRSIML